MFSGLGAGRLGLSPLPAAPLFTILPMSAPLSVSTEELLQSMATVMGVSRDPTDWDSNTLSDARRIIRSGIRRFMTPLQANGRIHQWRFLEKTLGFASPSDSPFDEDDGDTVTVVDGVVTMASGTFPTWAADGIFTVEGIHAFVASRDSNTQLTLVETSVQADAGSSFGLTRWKEALPSDFGEILGSVLYNQSNNPWRLGLSTEDDIRRRYAVMELTDRTRLFAISPPQGQSGGSGITASDRGEAMWWPPMDSGGFISGRYRAIVEDNLDDADIRTGDDSVIQMDGVHAGTLIEAILSEAESFYGLEGTHTALFSQRLEASIRHDKAMIGSVQQNRGRPYTLAELDRIARTSHIPQWQDNDGNLL